MARKEDQQAPVKYAVLNGKLMPRDEVIKVELERKAAEEEAEFEAELAAEAEVEKPAKVEGSKAEKPKAKAKDKAKTGDDFKVEG